MTDQENTSGAGLARRAFLKTSRLAGLGAAAALFGGASKVLAQNTATRPIDSASQIFTAALIAEDLATTFYYNALTGPVIMAPALAGPGGTATNPNPNISNPGNINYLQAALYQEIQHANLLRTLLGITSPASDPYQTFYFPSGSFDTITSFITLLEALESAFIGAYTIAVFEFSQLAAFATHAYDVNGNAGPYTPDQLEYFAEVAASILGVEAEHRALGRVIGNKNPANNLNYESTDGLTSVYNGSNSAVVALTPFITSTTGPAASFAAALAGAPAVQIMTTGNPPAQM